MYGQSRIMSILEQVAGSVVKFGAAMCVWQFIIAPLYGFEVPVHDNFRITLTFAINSIAIGYIVRRGFNMLHIKKHT